MGIEKVTITAKIEAENLLLIEGVRQNALPFPVSRSAALNLILSGVRSLIADGEISLAANAAQGLLRKVRGVGNEGIPEISPRRIEAPELARKAVSA